MIKPRPNERWKEILFNVKGMRNRYAISSQGRVASFRDEFTEGSILGGTLNNGYLSLKIKPGGRDLQMMIHRLVADAFLKRKNRYQQYVIHLNYNKTDNDSRNLRWASKTEMEKHQEKNPVVIKSRNARKTIGHKLNIPKVREIKRKIKSPGKMTMKSIARRFRISEMQLYRIKRGENWGHVKI
jgi:hypothetical protein